MHHREGRTSRLAGGWGRGVAGGRESGGMVVAVWMGARPQHLNLVLQARAVREDGL